MKSTVFAIIAAAAAVAVVRAAAFPEPVEPALKKRCDVGPPQTWIEDEILSICRSRNCNSVVLLATFETAYTESGFNNLDCGDQDSVGVFQQRPSQGWGNRGQLENVGYSTNAFLDVCIQLNQQHPDWPSGVLAQGVQGSELPEAYTQNEAAAKAILEQTEARAGSSDGGGAVNVAPAPSKPKSSPAPKSKPAPTPAKAKGAPKNLAKGTISKGCTEYYTVKAGNTCYFLKDKFGISSVSKFLSINKGVNKGCTNLQIGEAYCVKT